MGWQAKIAPAGPQVMVLRSRKRSEEQARVGPSVSAALPGGSVPFRRAGCPVVGDDGRRTFTAAPVPTLPVVPLRPSVLLLTALLGLTQCVMREGPDPEDRLPDATQTGQNTAGCRVDGRS